MDKKRTAGRKEVSKESRLEGSKEEVVAKGGKERQKERRMRLILPDVK